MDGLTNLMGEGGSIGFAVVGTLILMFFVSPLLSMVMGNAIKSRIAIVLGLASALGIFCVSTVGLSYAIPEILGENTPNTDITAIISTIIALIIALPMGMWVAWMFGEPQTSKFNVNDSSDISSPLSFEAKKHKRLKKKSRRR